MSKRRASPQLAHEASLRPCRRSDERRIAHGLGTSADGDVRCDRITSCVNNTVRYTSAVLQSFGDADTERVWQRQAVRKFHDDLQRAALRKLAMLDAADAIADLRIPSGNRLEKLSGDRMGQYSIRINDQWRICFRWTKAGPEDVSITDYH